MSPTDPPPPPRRARQSVGAYLATVVELATVISAVVFVASTSITALIVWEALTTAYLLAGLTVARRQSIRGDADAGRTGALDTLSWVLPLAASLVGVTAAVVAIAAQSSADQGQGQDLLLLVTASIGIILSWLLLHTGFAQVYESSQHRDPAGPGLEFPRKEEPTLLDFLYFAFTVGTSFATSDTTVGTSRMRWTVLVHSVVSFFYNALVVAVSIQILQQLVRI